MKFSEVEQTDRSLTKNNNKEIQISASASQENLDLHKLQDSNIENSLDSIIIRDATDKEKEELKILAEESVMNKDQSRIQEENRPVRCSILDFHGSNRKNPEDRGIAYSGVKQDDTFTLQSSRTSSAQENGEGFQTNRSSSSNSIQLTGIKPKALIFESPEKQTPTTKNGVHSMFGTTSTKEKTGSAGIGFGVSATGGFGGIKLMQCESHGDSPPIKKFQ